MKLYQILRHLPTGRQALPQDQAKISLMKATSDPAPHCRRIKQKFH